MLRRLWAQPGVLLGYCGFELEEIEGQRVAGGGGTAHPAGQESAHPPGKTNHDFQEGGVRYWSGQCIDPNPLCGPTVTRS